MDLCNILTINSIPVLESKLREVQDDLFKSQSDDEIISLIQREMLIRVRIKQIETILQD